MIGSFVAVASTPTLSILPPNQDVTASSGTTSFVVNSNSSWTTSSDQTWCSATPAGTGNGTITAAYSQNASVSQRVANITTTVSGISPVTVTVTQAGAPDKVLNITLFLEGLFNGTNMNKAQNATGNQYPGSVADQFKIELHSSTSPYILAGGPYTVNLNTDGTSSLAVSAALASTYYVVIKHRNSIETWSGSPLSFSGPTINYNFSSAASQAYGNNLKLVAGKYVLYAGDVNQDGIIDLGDMIPVDNDESSFTTGYLNSDVNGDGLVDSSDMILLDNNSALFISKVVP